MESLIQQKKRGAKRPGDSAQHLALNGINAVANQLGTQSAEEADEEHSNHKPLLPELEVSSPRYNALLRVSKFVVNRMVIVSCWWKMSRVAVGLCAPLIWSGRSTVGPVPLKHQTMDRHHPRLPRGLNAAGKGLAFAEHWFYLAVPEAHAQRGRSRQPSWKVRIQAQKGKASLL